jgi:ribonuclease HI
MSNLSYADDLTVLTDNMRHTQAQGRKIAQYADWADLTINLSKSTITAALHNTLRALCAPNSDEGKTFAKTRISGQVRLSTGHATYVPPTDPFVYLGIHFTILGDWRPQKQHNERIVASICDELISKQIPLPAKLVTLDRLVARKVAYTFPVTRYTHAELDKLDTIMNRVVRHSYSLTKNSPTAFLRATRSQFGLDRPSIRSLYQQESAKHLVWSINHRGLGGKVAQKLIRWQSSKVYKSPPAHSGTLDNHQFLRRLLYLRTITGCDLKVGNPTITQDHERWRTLMRCTTRYYESKYGRCPDLFTMETIMGLVDNPSDLMVSGHMLNERDFHRHYGRQAGRRHMRSYRYMTHVMTDSLPSAFTMEGGPIGALRQLPDPRLLIKVPHTDPPPTRGSPEATIITSTAEQDRDPTRNPGQADNHAPPLPYVQADEPPHSPKTAPTASWEMALALLKEDTYEDTQTIFTELTTGGIPPLAALDILFGSQDRPLEITASNLVNTEDGGQRQYRVKWADTLIEDWAIQHYQDSGYNPTSMTTVHKARTTSHCWLCSFPTDPYLGKCEGGCPRLGPDTPIQMTAVEWEPTFEPELNLRAEGHGAMIDEWWGHYTATSRLPHTLLPSRQTLFSHTEHTDHPPDTNPPPQGGIGFELLGTNPETWVTPPRQHSDWWVTIQRVQEATRPKNLPPQITEHTRAILHSADGQEIARCEPADLSRLWRLHNNDTDQQQTRFADDVRDLLRLGDSAPTESRQPTLQRAKALHSQYGFDLHIHADPLSCMDGAEYTSPVPLHRKFGAILYKKRPPLQQGARILATPNRTAAYTTLSLIMQESHTRTGPFVAVLLTTHGDGTGFLRLAHSHPSMITVWEKEEHEEPDHPLCIIISNSAAHPAPPTGWTQKHAEDDHTACAPLRLPRRETRDRRAGRKKQRHGDSTDTEETYGHRLLTDPNLKYLPGDIWYTDGSVAHVPGTGHVATGAAWSHRASQSTGGETDTYLLIPGADTPSSNVAELVIIRECLTSHHPKVVATDSLASMQQIRNYLQRPHAYDKHPCREILRQITDYIRGRSTWLTIVKVKAHSGNPGNEWCDWLATQARLRPAEAKLVDYPRPEHKAWIYVTSPDGRDTHPIADLNKSLRSLCDAAHGMAGANTDTTYFQAYQNIASQSHQSSHNFITSKHVPPGARRLAIKYRMGQIYNQKLAHRYGRSHNSDCPLCGEPDSQTHMMGGCTHTEMHDMYCKRHNDAATLIVLHMHLNATPTTPIQTHVGRPKGVPTLTGLPDVVPGCQPHHSRPDFTLRDTKIHLVEVKYGQDTRLEEKLRGIHDTLSRTRDAVERAQHMETFIRPILLGVGGRIPQLTFDTIMAMGSTHAQAQKICNKLNHQAVLWMHKIVKARRRLHAQSDNPHPPP